MQIVIDINDNLYTRLFDNGVDNYNDVADMAKAIRKGIPLPKGHGRLIDADKLLKEARIDIWTDYGFESKISSIDVESAPIIIEADKGSE